ncbi:hypothetical protein K439DRAFT_1409669 [Ramaria rubella]|nr:hypothetical protein K439DRAFT_1409669 [Ramaria rubella]
MDEDYTPLLSTGYYPDSDYGVVKARLERQYCELRLVDEKVADLEEQLSAMKSIRAMWQLRCEVSEALLAPIRKLPHEILGRIFSFCIPPLRDIKVQHDRQGHPQHVRCDLLRVCRRWKQVMDETPEVWSAIELDPPIEVLEILLAKSKACPIDISIGPRIQSRSKSYCLDIVPILHKNIPRLRTFLVDMDGDQRLSLEKLFSSTCGTEMPNLRYLELNVELDDGVPFLGVIHAPGLVSLHLGEEMSIGPLAPDSFRSLRQMNIKTTVYCPTFYLDFLSACHNLEILSWTALVPMDMMEFESADVPASVPHTKLPLLKHFQLSGDDLRIFRPALDRLQLPLLESLEIEMWEEHTDFEVFQTITIPCLRKLSTSGIDLVVAADISQYIASLSELDFHECSIEDSFFSTLCLMTPQAFSQLESICLQSCNFSVSDLADFIQSKCRPGGAARSCHVHISSPWGMSNDDLKHLKDTHGHAVSYEDFGDGSDHNSESDIAPERV